MRYTILTLASLLTALNALTITYPGAGVSVDPSQPVTIKWTSTSSDPSTINLVFTNNGAQQTLGSNVQTSSGSYTVPANTILTYGSGFTISAQSSGNTVATSGAFILAYGGTIVTNSAGQRSLVSTGAAATGAATSTASSITFETTGLEGQSVTATYFPGTATDSGSVSTSGTGRPFTTHGPQSFSTTLSGSSSATSASATSASTQNAQPRVMVGKEVMSVAGFLAGLVALVA